MLIWPDYIPCTQRTWLRTAHLVMRDEALRSFLGRGMKEGFATLSEKTGGHSRPGMRLFLTL